MSIFTKSVDEISLDDVRNLVDAKERENINLEYKAEIRGSGNDKKELAKDISAFANSEGGYLIIGIEEEEGVPKTIRGTSKIIGRQKVEEWIENVLISNISQKVITNIKVLPLSERSDKVVVIIYVPVSPKKPHMVTCQGENRYYKRHQFQVLPANEMEVRQMFESARQHLEELATFMKDRNLDDERGENFGRRPLVNSLVKDFAERQKGQGMSPPKESFVLFGICPRWLEEKVNVATDDFEVWLNSKRRGYYPNENVDLISLHRQIRAGSLVAKNLYPGIAGEERLREYVEIFRNGYIEMGMSAEFFGYVPQSDPPQPVLHLTSLVGFFFIFLGFANEFYQYIKYYDQLEILMCLVNIDGTMLGGFGKKNDKERYAEPWEIWYSGRSPVCYDKNVKLEKTILAQELNKNTIIDIAYYFAERVSNAFGEKIAKCFDDNRNFNKEGFSFFTV